jgi:hypothetical protein
MCIATKKFYKIKEKERLREGEDMVELHLVKCN